MSQKLLQKNNLSSQQQQMLLMNVLISQGMDKAQAHAHVQAQLANFNNQASKQMKESRNSAMDIRQSSSQMNQGSIGVSKGKSSGRHIAHSNNR